MNQIRTLIVDDEPLSRNELKHLLSEFVDIEIVGEASSGEKGFDLAMKLQPDVIFLDIEMAEMSGVALADHLQQLKKMPLIVFATAYPDYAVKAFRLKALDYLLKPFDAKQLLETIERIRKYDDKDKSHPDMSTQLGKLAVEMEDEITFISPKDIHYCSREGSKTLVSIGDQIFISRMTLKELEEKLTGHSFFRVHKGYLVNLNKVVSLSPWLNGAYHLKIEGNKKEIPVSRNYIKQLRQKLEL